MKFFHFACRQAKRTIKIFLPIVGKEGEGWGKANRNRRIRETQNYIYS